MRRCGWEIARGAMEHRCRRRRFACPSGVDDVRTGIDYRAVTSLGHLMVVDSQNIDMHVHCPSAFAAARWSRSSAKPLRGFS